MFVVLVNYKFVLVCLYVRSIRISMNTIAFRIVIVKCDTVHLHNKDKEFTNHNTINNHHGSSCNSNCKTDASLMLIRFGPYTRHPRNARVGIHIHPNKCPPHIIYGNYTHFDSKLKARRLSRPVPAELDGSSRQKAPIRVLQEKRKGG